MRGELGRPVRARTLGSSPRSRVWRAELSGSPVVIKQLVEGPGADERYAREVAALRLASRVRPPVVPALLGTDPDARVLVLEHLEHRPPAEDWIVGYATALARLHAATTSVTVPHGVLDGDLPDWAGPTGADVDSFLGLAQALGVPVPAGVRVELDALVDRLTGTPGHALLHGDPCPGNDMHTADGVRFIDFEQAALGHGIVELAYLRIGFPTCWCATAPAAPLLTAAETAYRTAWRAATGTEVQGDLTDACAGWLLRGDALVQRAHRGTTDQLARIPHDDWRWGTATARQRLAHRLGVVAGAIADTEGITDLGGLGRLATDLRAALLTLPHRLKGRGWGYLPRPSRAVGERPQPSIGPLPARRP
nr:aminoglycoside phosphotransferase family protein [Streptomyces sp. ODS25]